MSKKMKVKNSTQFLAMNDNIKKCENLKYLDLAFLAALRFMNRQNMHSKQKLLTTSVEDHLKCGLDV